MFNSLIFSLIEGKKSKGMYSLSEFQVSAILELILQKLTALGISEIEIEIFTYTNSEELSFHRVWTNPLTKADGLKLCNLFKKQQVVCILQLNKQVN